jgi:hypothetical protein
MITLKTRCGTIRVNESDIYLNRYMVPLLNKKGQKYIDTMPYELRRRFHINEFICRENISNQIVDDITEMKWLIEMGA